MSDINIEDIKPGDKITIYAGARSQRLPSEAGRYYTLTVDEPDDLAPRPGHFVVSHMPNPLARAGVSVAEAAENIRKNTEHLRRWADRDWSLNDEHGISAEEARAVEKATAWMSALIVRATGRHPYQKDTVTGLFTRDVDGKHWFHDYDHDAYETRDLSDVTVVIDADGRNVEAEAHAEGFKTVESKLRKMLRAAEKRAEKAERDLTDARAAKNYWTELYWQTIDERDKAELRIAELEADQNRKARRELGELSAWCSERRKFLPTIGGTKYTRGADLAFSFAEEVIEARISAIGGES